MVRVGGEAGRWAPGNRVSGGKANVKKRFPNRAQRDPVWFGLVLVLLWATCCTGTVAAAVNDDDCLDCFLLAEESEQPYELTMEASAEAGLSESGPTEVLVEAMLRHPNSTCRWMYAGPLASELYALYDAQLEGRCVRTGAIHHEEDALERTFYCFDAELLLALCKLRKETELRRLERMATQRRKRDYHPTGCSLNNLLSTNRKVYEFGLEHEGLKPTSQIVLSTIFLVTDVLSEFYNRRIAGFYDPGRHGGPGSTTGSDSSKGNPPIEVILLQTIKHQILHKLGLRERPRLTKHLNNEYVFEAFDRIYGNRINIGNSYAEEHYYRRYLTANLSSDLSGDFVDAFFRGPEGREATERSQSPQPKQKSTKTGKQTSASSSASSTADPTGSDKHNLFAGTKILSYAEKG